MSSDGETRTIALPGAQRVRGFGPRLLQRLMSCVEVGRVTFVTPSGTAIHYEGTRPGPEAKIVLRNWRPIRRLITGGDVAFAETYIAGDWSSPDITALLEFATANGEHLFRRIAGWWPVRLFNRTKHARNANSRTGSRRNIAFHYDLGNEFYRLWLDKTLTYSSALYDERGLSLEAAQEAKLRRIGQLLDLSGGEDILEIGFGWGALAKRLAEAGANRVVGLTLSNEQLVHANGLMERAGLDSRVELRLQDYRDVTGQFDRIVSIEMLEAVGEQYWPTYFQTLHDRLKPGGTAVVQVITIRDDLFEPYKRNADFIQRYVFPGGMLPSKAIVGAQASAAGLTLAATETFGASYALTLAEWHRRFVAAWPDIERLGFDDAFKRMWLYYLCYCEAGFRTGQIDVGFYVLRKESAAAPAPPIGAAR